jgi:hypothetical protein
MFVLVFLCCPVSAEAFATGWSFLRRRPTKCSRLGGLVVIVRLPLDPEVAGSNPAKEIDF